MDTINHEMLQDDVDPKEQETHRKLNNTMLFLYDLGFEEKDMFLDVTGIPTLAVRDTIQLSEVLRKYNNTPDLHPFNIVTQ